jgi:hypothetical protein
LSTVVVASIGAFGLSAISLLSLSWGN